MRSQTSASMPPSTSDDVDLVEGADDDRAHEVELGGVGQHDDLAARAADHGELDARRGDARGREAGPGVEEVGAQERLVGVEMLDHVERPGALDGVEGGAVEAAEQHELEAHAARLGGGREAGRDDSRFELRVDVAQHVHHGRARAQKDRVARFDHGGGGARDAVLLGGVRDGVVFVARQVRRLVAAHGAAVGAGEDAFLLEEHEVAADGDLGDAEVFAQRVDPHGGLRPQGSDDARAPFGRQHLPNVRSGQATPPPEPQRSGLGMTVQR